MNKKLAAILAVATLGAVCMPASAQFGKLGGMLGGGSGSSASVDPDAFVASAQTAEKLMNNSVTLLSRSLASKDTSADLAAQRKAANEITDPAEKKAKLTEVQKSELALVNESLSKASIDSEIKKMDDKQRADLGAAAFNFMLALLQDKALLEQGQGLAKSMTSNPAALTKMGSIKNAVSSLSSQISAASSIAGKMPAIFSAVDVKAPASKDEKPKAVAQVTEE